MTWSDTPIDGQQSVAANKTPLNNAFTYIANTMDNDHFWDDSNSNLDGRHQFVQMPKNESGGNPANPSLGTDMDGVIYYKDKTATDAPDLQMAEPHALSYDGSNNQILQLGFRAMIHFEVSGGGVVTEKYAHNCSVVRDGTGLFTLTFDTALPSDNYIVFGTAQRSSGNALVVATQSGTKAAKMTTTTYKFVTASTSDSARDPIVVTLAVCGG